MKWHSYTIPFRPANNCFGISGFGGSAGSGFPAQDRLRRRADRLCPERAVAVAAADLSASWPWRQSTAMAELGPSTMRKQALMRGPIERCAGLSPGEDNYELGRELQQEVSEALSEPLFLPFVRIDTVSPASSRAFRPRVRTWLPADDTLLRAAPATMAPSTTKDLAPLWAAMSSVSIGDDLATPTLRRTSSSQSGGTSLLSYRASPASCLASPMSSASRSPPNLSFASPFSETSDSDDLSAAADCLSTPSPPQIRSRRPRSS